MKTQIFKLFILFNCLLGTISATTQDNIPEKFILEGRFTTPSSGIVFLAYSFNNNLILDSCNIIDGKFKFTGLLHEPVRTALLNYRPGSNDKDGFAFDFYIEPGVINFSGEFRSQGTFELIGSKTDRDRVKLYHQDSAIKALVQRNYEIAKNIYIKTKSSNDQEKLISKHQIDSIATIISDLEKEVEKMDSIFIINNPQSFVSLDKLFGLRSRFKREDAESLVEKFPPYILSSSAAKRFLIYMEREKHINPGDTAPKFKAIDYWGKSIDLSNFRNKYVLLDFWASWCSPCRRLAPELKLIQKKYQDKLQIISIAKETDRLVWEKAIKDDLLTKWPQIFENSNQKPIQPINKLITDAYYVFTLPTLILIDRQGQVVTKFGDGYSSKLTSDLSKELSKILDQ
jgi:thiol-disulfide isomerase/thioredoxin